MSKSTEQSIKQKLKNISKESRVPFNSLLDTLFLERFLVRIGNSKYSDKLIFKGGMCLAQIIELGRETRDIDFLLTQIKGSIGRVKSLIEEVATVEVGDDFEFSNIDIGELSIEHKKYPGYRVSVLGTLGQIKNKVSIDIGVGDVVHPHSLEVELMSAKGPLFEETINLQAYLPEYIFSEKLEAILHLGESNSHMKDFYDCYRLIQEGVLDKRLLKKAIAETLENRETEFSLIPGPTEDFNIKWKAFLKKNRLTDIDLSDVITIVNQFLTRK